MKNELIKLAAELEKLRLEASSIYKLAGEAEYDYLVKMNLSSINETPGPDVNKKEFYAKLKERAEDGEGIFNKDTLETMYAVSEDNIPTTNRKEFTKWLANCIQEEPETRYYIHRSLSTIKDWYMATNPNINLMTFLEAADYAEAWHQQLAEAPEKQLASGKYITNIVEHEFKDGWKIVYVPAANETIPFSIEEYGQTKLLDGTSWDRTVEGDLMGICLGRESQLYQNNNYGKIYSLRDPKNHPHMTIRVLSNQVLEARGKGNSDPIKYNKYLKEFCEEKIFYTKEYKKELHDNVFKDNASHYGEQVRILSLYSNYEWNVLVSDSAEEAWEILKMERFTEYKELFKERPEVKEMLIKKAFTHPVFAVEYAKNFEPSDFAREMASRDPYYATVYATRVDGGPHSVTRDGACGKEQSNDDALIYAQRVDKTYSKQTLDAYIRGSSNTVKQKKLMNYYTYVPNTPPKIVFQYMPYGEAKIRFLYNKIAEDAAKELTSQESYLRNNDIDEIMSGLLEKHFQILKEEVGFNEPKDYQELRDAIKEMGEK